MSRQAHLWGRKAAREGLPVSLNPCRGLEDRLAWTKGHREELEVLAKIKEGA